MVDTDRDPAVLAAACEAVFDRIGRQIVTMGTDEAHNLVCCRSLYTTLHACCLCKGYVIIKLLTLDQRY